MYWLRSLTSLSFFATQSHGGVVQSSLLSRMLDDFEQLGIEDKVRYDSIKDVCGSMYRGVYVGMTLLGKNVLTLSF